MMIIMRRGGETFAILARTLTAGLSYDLGNWYRTVKMNDNFRLLCMFLLTACTKHSIIC